MIAWEKCAEANERTGNDWHAGKHLEQCAQLAKDLKQHDQVVAYAERACAAYVSAGRAQRGAECLGKTARLIDEAAPDVTVRLFGYLVIWLFPYGQLD